MASGAWVGTNPAIATGSIDEPDRSRTTHSDDVARCRAPMSVALVGTYPPTECGLATFTRNLRAAIAERSSGWRAAVVRVLDRYEPAPSGEVVEQWVAGDSASLRRSLAVLNDFDAVLLQHEYGLFGGRDGAQVLDLIDGLQVPLVAVLHTALLEPSAHQREVLERILDSAAVAVVQSQAELQRIVAVHEANPDAVIMIPHGAAPNFSGPMLSDIPRPSVLTWGLLSPGKGIEHGIAAIARLGIHSPAISYIVAGETHPKVRVAHGEQYRDALEVAGIRSWRGRARPVRRRVPRLGIARGPRAQRRRGAPPVRLARPGQFRRARRGPRVGQTRRGDSLPHAVELLAGGAGILVDHGDVDGMAHALERVLYEDGLGGRMASAAREAATPLLWPAVGASYRSLVNRVVAARTVA